MENKLSACPFCGGEAKWSKTPQLGFEFIICTKCHCSTPVWIDADKARETWNTRYTPAPRC
ncbi:Lar family restriction alleviation protein [Ruminococcaceae bacterium OttesenSCG-928-I18]|nr:Lar family restriction alleviation protein [Ruminococcaceae bacterium OttesenSCG-928-I18]